MTLVPTRELFVPAGLAVIMHLLLFAAFQPKIGRDLGGLLVPPNTSYIGPSVSDFSMSGNEVRTIQSPVIFSLPSNMGFSRELTDQDVRTRLTFSKQVETERFLDVDSAIQEADAQLQSQELMLTAGPPSAPGLPTDIYQPVENRTAARRVNLAPELKERLLGGVVLSVELNQQTSSSWEIRASVSVSEQGMVKHVFLDQPLESVALNQQVLQLLYGLRFKAGEAVEGSVEIYSPEAAPNVEAAP
ncbi:MAG: hypothetical protein V3V05_05145 [Pontiella sp.]